MSYILHSPKTITGRDKKELENFEEENENQEQKKD